MNTGKNGRSVRVKKSLWGRVRVKQSLWGRVRVRKSREKKEIHMGKWDIFTSYFWRAREEWGVGKEYQPCHPWKDNLLGYV